MSENTPQIIPLVDENGNTTNFSVIAALENQGNRYVLLRKYPVVTEEDTDLFILKLFLDDNGEEYLSQIESREEFETVMKIFKEKLTESANTSEEIDA